MSAMEKIGSKTIEVNFCTKLEFDVYPCTCKVGDTVWFDDGIPDEDGTITCHSYMRGKVKEIEPDKWWVYDDGKKELGFVTVEVEDDDFYVGQKFSVAFKDIIYQSPTIRRFEDTFNSVDMKRVSFKVAKTLKKAGYPQVGYYWYSPQGVECYSESDLDEIRYVSAPTYNEVWLWLCRAKHIAFEKAIECLVDNNLIK